MRRLLFFTLLHKVCLPFERKLPKGLLSSSGTNVNEIAYHVGFASPKYFHRTFHALAGGSPAAVRRQYSKH